MLRARVGVHAFFIAMRSYYAKHRHSTVLTDDLRSEMEHVSKRRLKWFFDQWLLRPSYPEVTAMRSYDASAHEVDVAVTQTPRLGMVKFPLTVQVVDFADLRHSAVVEMPAVSMRQVRIGLASPPLRVDLDPEVESLAALRVVRQ